MENLSGHIEYKIRAATSADARNIRQLIHLVHINPTGLSWRRFIVAVDVTDTLIGSGQVKPHKDGSLELASIAVLPEWRGRGVARKIIERLLEQYPGQVYLMCRSPLEPLYKKFGFSTIGYDEMPFYFQQISRLADFYGRLRHETDSLSVMRRK
jgi:N-acetylglutamate synthase-like GNAT family acetyltransferase